MENLPDQESIEKAQALLLHRIAEGDIQSMAAFYDATAGALFSLAVRILTDREEAEEVIQDVFMQIWEKAGTFDPLVGSAFHWAMSIARYRSIDKLRARQRRSRLMEQLTDAESASASSSDWSRSALNSDEIAGIHSALKTLPPEQQVVIEMAFFAGKTHNEISQALNEPLGTIKARIRRAMLKLRDSLQAYIC